MLLEVAHSGLSIDDARASNKPYVEGSGTSTASQIACRHDDDKIKNSFQALLMR